MMDLLGQIQFHIFIKNKKLYTQEAEDLYRPVKNRKNDIEKSNGSSNDSVDNEPAKKKK